MTPNPVAVFVERLLDDWEGGERFIFNDRGVGQAEYDAMCADIAARRAEWAALSSGDRRPCLRCHGAGVEPYEPSAFVDGRQDYPSSHAGEP